MQACNGIEQQGEHWEGGGAQGRKVGKSHLSSASLPCSYQWTVAYSFSTNINNYIINH